LIEETTELGLLISLHVSAFLFLIGVYESGVSYLGSNVKFFFQLNYS